MCELMPSSLCAPPQESLPRSLSPIAGRTWVLRLLIILGFGLALGACSKCAMPDLGHWGPRTHATTAHRSSEPITDFAKMTF